MKFVVCTLAVVVLFATAATCAVAAAEADDAVPISQLRWLRLSAREMTTHRRVDAVPQMRCVEDCKQLWLPETARCHNVAVGTDSPEWTCWMDLPADVWLHASHVTCEGYTSADDTRVLRGSCALEYSLRSRGHTSTNREGLMIGLFFVGVVMLIVLLAMTIICLGTHRPAPALGDATNTDGFVQPATDYARLYAVDDSAMAAEAALRSGPPTPAPHHCRECEHNRHSSDDDCVGDCLFGFLLGVLASGMSDSRSGGSSSSWSSGGGWKTSSVRAGMKTR